MITLQNILLEDVRMQSKIDMLFRNLSKRSINIDKSYMRPNVVSLDKALDVYRIWLNYCVKTVFPKTHAHINIVYNGCDYYYEDDFKLICTNDDIFNGDKFKLELEAMIPEKYSNGISSWDFGTYPNPLEKIERDWNSVTLESIKKHLEEIIKMNPITFNGSAYYDKPNK